MRKENVFLVTGRLSGGSDAEGETNGALLQRVVCAADERALFEFIQSGFPGFDVVGAVNLAKLETTVADIKQALLGSAGSLPVFLDPAM